MRAARNTLRILQQSGTVEDPESEVSFLRNYLAINQPDEERVLSPEEAAAIKRET